MDIQIVIYFPNPGKEVLERFEGFCPIKAQVISTKRDVMVSVDQTLIGDVCEAMAEAGIEDAKIEVAAA